MAKFKHYINKDTIVCAIVFTIIALMGLFYKTMHEDLVVYRWQYPIAAIILFVVIYLALSLIYIVYDKVVSVANTGSINPKVLGIVSFAVIWLECTLVFLNIYPGAYSVDSPAQLGEAISMGGYENLNPLINTLVIMLFVQIGMAIKDINLGVALYTFVQYTWYAGVATYAVLVINKTGLPKWIKWVPILFFAWPINVIFAVTMWKDTFFSVFFLWTSAYLLMLFTDKDNTLDWKRGLKLFVLIYFTSLARNSGWSALIIGAIFLLVYGLRKQDSDKKENGKYVKIAFLEIGAIALALFTTSVIYPAMGVHSLNGSTGTAVMVQQMSRVIIEDEVTESDLPLYSEAGITEEEYEGIRDNYDPILVDAVRGYYDVSDIGRFLSSWYKIGLKHPREYAMAFVDHTAGYWWVEFNAEWFYDDSLWENEFGLERTSLFLDGVKLTREMLIRTHYLNRITKMVCSSAFALWLIIMCMYISARRNNRVSHSIIIPYVMVYIGLLLFSYGYLFRYSFAAVIAVPVIIGSCELKRYESRL